MSARPLILWLLLLLGVGFLSSAVAGEASVPADTTHIRPDTSGVPVSSELVLDEIYIEAVIEKPNVAILPARVETDFGAVEFIDRSFARELRESPERILFFDLEFELVSKMEKLKELIKKERARLRK